MMMRTNPHALWLLAGSVQTRASSNFAVMSTFGKEGRRASLLNFCEPGHEAFMLRVLRVPSWKRGKLSLKVLVLEKNEFFSNNRLGLGEGILVFWPIVIQALVKIAQTGVLMQMH